MYLELFDIRLSQRTFKLFNTRLSQRNFELFNTRLRQRNFACLNLRCEHDISYHINYQIAKELYN